MSDKPTLPPGVLPGITDTDPPPMDPSTIVGDGFVGAPPSCEDTPHVLYDGTTLSCTQGNWTGTPTSYAYQWQMDGADVEGAVEAVLTPAEGAAGEATCLVTAKNDYGETAAPPSNGVVIGGTSRRRAAARHEPEHHEPEGRRHPQQDYAGRHE